jgi:hypothetical protein
MIGVPWNVRVALGSICVEREQQAQRERKKRQEESCNPRRHDAGGTRSQQEVIPGECDRCRKKEDNELRGKCEGANKRATAVEEENDGNMANDEASNARNERRKAQPNRRRRGTSGSHHLTRHKIRYGWRERASIAMEMRKLRSRGA